MNPELDQPVRITYLRPSTIGNNRFIPKIDSRIVFNLERNFPGYIYSTPYYWPFLVLFISDPSIILFLFYLPAAYGATEIALLCEALMVVFFLFYRLFSVFIFICGQSICSININLLLLQIGARTSVLQSRHDNDLKTFADVFAAGFKNSSAFLCIALYRIKHNIL